MAGTNKVSLYGHATGSFFIGSNGYLTTGAGDTEYAESYTAHFNRPRIAALFRDLFPPAGGTISWRQLSDKMVVTYQGIADYVNQTDSNNFQVEWFFDGRIRITYLRIDANSGLVGLSRGGGLPVGFDTSDFNSYASCDAPPHLSISRSGASVVVGWTSMMGRSYRVERKAQVDGVWTNAGPDLIATGFSSAVTNSITAPQMFYRVSLLLP